MQVNPDLLFHLHHHILPQYHHNENGHGVQHAQYVARRSLKFARQVPDIDYDMVYTIALYHDLGHHFDAARHEIISSQLLAQDPVLKQFFTATQIRTMSDAVLRHRSSNPAKLHTIYDRIIVAADRRTSIDDALRSTYSYRRIHNPTLSLEQTIEDSRQHLLAKYGPSGYAATEKYFDDPEFDNFTHKLTELTQDPVIFKAHYLKSNHLSPFSS